MVIIGGGPAAAIQLEYGARAAREVLVISDRWGAPGMRFLGDARLQSYVHELSLTRTPVIPVTSPGSLQPTGAEYDRYARAVLEASDAVLYQARVVGLSRSAEGFQLLVRDEAGSRTIDTSLVVLATGSRPREPAGPWSAAGAVTYAQVCRDVANGTLARYAGRRAVVVGSGNSALQVAALLASLASEVTVLASKYLGMYPTESDDRFAWRAPSQLTWELVVKSGRGCRAGKLPCACTRFLVYDSLDLTGGDVRFTCAAVRNDHQMGHHSLPLCHPHAAAERMSDDRWRERIPVAGTTIVWATGSQPCYPPSALIDSMPRDLDGYLEADRHGQTSVPGLLVTGACAGQRSVNDMVPALMSGREAGHATELEALR